MDLPRTNRDHPVARRSAWVETYGCQMNISDGELMQGVLQANGYTMAASPEEADVILVNTCAIRDHAEQRVIGRVGELNRIKRERPELVIGVTGCMAQRIGEAILGRASHVDLVMGPDGYRSLASVLARLRPGFLPSPVPSTESAPQVDGHRHEVAERGGAKSEAVPREAVASGRRALPVLGHADSPVAGEDALAREAPKAERVAALELAADENYEGLEVRRASKITAWVPIQRGCNYRCTY
jgi:tRNA-2-methylthio-N6-dimethylallyladenosine synthase